MNVKGIHSLIFLFLVAITANMAHVVIAHEDEACEICLHIQSNDDSLTTSAEASIPSVEVLNAVQFNYPDSILESTFNSDPIRGPPQVS